MELIFENNNEPLVNGSPFTEATKKTIDYDAIIRFGESIVRPDRSDTVDLVMGDTFISIIPGIEAIYYISKVGISQKELDDDKYGWSEDFFCFDYSIAIPRRSKFGYLWLTTNEIAFLKEMRRHHRSTDWLKRAYSKVDPAVPDKQFTDSASKVSLIDCVVTHNPFGGRDLVVNDTYISINSGARAVYFMSDNQFTDGEDWDMVWSVIQGVEQEGIGAYQRSSAGNTWWIYDEIAYAKECENVGLNPTQFKISPKFVF